MGLFVALGWGGHLSPARLFAPAWGRSCSSRRGQQGDLSPGLPILATAFPAPNHGLDIPAVPGDGGRRALQNEKGKRLV